jgi:hypothetical protein
VSWWRWGKCKNKEGIKNAEQALEREKQAGKDVAAKRAETDKLADDLERHRRENNFSRLIEDSMHLRGRRSP